MTDEAAATTKPAPLEDLMLAMDVVDTLRHQQDIVDRELNAEERRAQMIERLRDIYRSQGIDVPDSVLTAGVLALEEDRFSYQPPTTGLSIKLAHLYINRASWLKPLVAITVLLGVLWAAYYMLVTLPDTRVRAALPDRLSNTFGELVKESDERAVIDRAQTLLKDARSALKADDLERARALHGDMRSLLEQLKNEYKIQIVSRPNQLSGVWRVPPNNPGARNYYLIVEAVAPDYSRKLVMIENEEDGRAHLVSSWGLRVDEDTFEAVAADKRDDGIIQDDIVGTKTRGRLDPEYRVRTTGAAITEW